jgi:cobalt-zinc-cadmium efflux system outer membrane protein
MPVDRRRPAHNGRKLISIAAVTALAAIVGAAPASALDLVTAISRALAADPRLSAAGFDIDAARGSVIQAGKYPNPEASLEIENFAGSGEVSGFDSAEITLGIQQKFERGGKRDARLQEAVGKEDVANAQIAILRREIVAQTKIDYVAVLAGMAEVELLERSVKRLEALLPQLEKRVEAGASLKADVARGKLAVGRARVALEKARSTLTARKEQLVSNWAGTLSDARHVSGRLKHNGHRTVALAELLPLIDQHPAIRAWDAVREERMGNVSVQYSLAVPDVTLGAGVRRFNETDDTGFVVTGSIPLPVHDRNEGNIMTSEALLAKVRFEREAARRVLRRKLIEAHGERRSECLESQRLYEVVVPAGRTASADVNKGFEQGRLTAKDVLDAYAALLEVELLQVEADTRCHVADVKVETLVSRRPSGNGWQTTTERAQP